MAGGLFDRGIAHSRDLREVDILFLYEVQSRGGVRLAGLLHAGSDDPLEVFLFRHHDLLRSSRERSSPAASSATTKSSLYRSGSMPPFASAGVFAGGRPSRLGADQRRRKSITPNSAKSSHRNGQRMPEHIARIPPRLDLLQARVVRFVIQRVP